LIEVGPQAIRYSRLLSPHLNFDQPQRKEKILDHCHSFIREGIVHLLYVIFGASVIGIVLVDL
jgi:hypothetical protein